MKIETQKQYNKDRGHMNLKYNIQSNNRAYKELSLNSGETDAQREAKYGTLSHSDLSPPPSSIKDTFIPFHNSIHITPKLP